MDILHLVDRLEDLIDEGRHVPMSKYTMIDEERALEIIDQMRISVPEEIEKSRRVIQQRDRMMAQANEEASRMVELAREKGEGMVTREAIALAAQNHATAIIEQARREAENIQVGADDYVMGVLGELESQLIRTLTVVRNGINAVNQRPAEQAMHAEPEASNETLPVREDVSMPVEQEAGS